MLDEKIFAQLKERVSEELKECPGHDINHVMRVYNLALTIAEGEGEVNWEVLQAATLLHDIGGARETADPTGKTDHAVESARMAGPILTEAGFSPEKIKHVQECIVSHRYKTDNEPQTLEAKILFDADKLDALGAIGLARAFIWIGKNKGNIYKKLNPTELDQYIKDNLSGSIRGRIQDKTLHSPQIEFETKTKYLPDKLYTTKGRAVGQGRMEYYRDFLDRLEREVKGEL
ncbi:MAG: HD domain-containing protein [Patescibacteria group bacterium]|jgi:uncharacterized protein